MKSNNFLTIILIGIGILIITIIIVMYTKSPENYNKLPKKSYIANEPFKYNDFIITNHLLQAIRVESLNINNLNDSKILIDRVEPKSKHGISHKKVLELIRQNRKLRVYLLKDDGECLYADYDLDLCPDKTIKALHIGMITSRYVGAGHDDNWKPAANAVQGRPFVKLHNMTYSPILLNEHIIIPALGVIKYHGRDAFGVRVGTIFEDSNRNHQTFKMKRPATDIYFGVTSDLIQPLFGGWQIDSEFDDEADEPYYLLEAGWMGGPANGSIIPGFVPKEGLMASSFDNVDEWGELE